MSSSPSKKAVERAKKLLVNLERAALTPVQSMTISSDSIVYTDNNLMMTAEAIEEAVARTIKAIDDEPELPDSMPDEMWDALKNADRETMTFLLRAVVKTTKDGIRARVKKGEE